MSPEIRRPLSPVARRRCTLGAVLAVLVAFHGTALPAAAGEGEIETRFHKPNASFLQRTRAEIGGMLERLGGLRPKRPAPIRLVEYSRRVTDDPPEHHCRCCPRRTLCSALDYRDDFDEMWPTLKDDARGLVNWNNGLILGGALGASIAIRQDLDAEVRADTARHPERWGVGTEVLGGFGEAQYQIPALLAVYGWSLHRRDSEMHEFSKSVISAYTINGLSTLLIKGIANTDRPSDDWNGGQFGFPSFHASSSFTIASVVEEYYGPKAAAPAYALAGLISWSRIDERDHDLSDVVFGAALGYVIGHSVARRHRIGDSRVRLLPYLHPGEGSTGLMLDLEF